MLSGKGACALKGAAGAVELEAAIVVKLARVTLGAEVTGLPFVGWAGCCSGVRTVALWDVVRRRRMDRLHARSSRSRQAYRRSRTSGVMVTS